MDEARASTQPPRDLLDDNESKGDLSESTDNVVGTGFGTITDIALGADGAFYVSLPARPEPQPSTQGVTSMRIRTRSSIALLLLLLLPLPLLGFGLAACGGSDSDGGEAPSGGAVDAATVLVDDSFFDPETTTVAVGAHRHLGVGRS